MSDLHTMTGPELVAEYNRLASVLGVAQTKRFADRKSGIRRIEGLRAQMPTKQEAVRKATKEYTKAAKTGAEAEGDKERFPLEGNKWHARQHKKNGRAKRDVIEMVFQNMLDNREGTTIEDEGTGETWAEVYLDNCGIDGMPDKIWAGHLAQLSKEGRYKKVKGRSGAFGMVLVG